MKGRAVTNHAAGLAAETLAALLLQFKGYRILARRYKTPMGEIDLVARRRNVVAFVEVKRRAGLDDALGAVSPVMQARIARAARHFVSRHPVHAECDLRFDLIAVAPPFRVRHLDNAWLPPS